jgi:ferric-dicitrate binding protein FerR (iron transport regulator)
MDNEQNEHFNDELPFEFNKPNRDDALLKKSRQDLLNSITSSKPRKRRRIMRIWLPVVTACVLLAGLLAVFNRKRPGPMAVFQTRDNQRTILLPDSSQIILNRFSEVRADLQNWSNSNREVWLTGEAFFEIRKVLTGGSHYNNFIVHTGKGDIEVLGTSFNVHTDSLGFSTALHTGSIKAHIGKDEVISLVPGQMLVVQGNTIYKKQVNVQLYSAWKDGEFHFDNTSLAEVIELIKKNYNLSVRVAEHVPVKELKLSGNISVKDSGRLFNALRVILELQVQQKGDSLIINK